MNVESVLASALDGTGLTYREHRPGEYLVSLPGNKKLQTMCRFLVGDHALGIEAFVCRRPDEAHEKVYRFLLRRNAKLYGVHYTLDALGDIYLVGKLNLETLAVSEVDKFLGQILEAADADFNAILELGFVSSIRREWAWRTSRGESLINLQAFAHLAPPED